MWSGQNPNDGKCESSKDTEEQEFNPQGEEVEEEVVAVNNEDQLRITELEEALGNKTKFNDLLQDKVKLLQDKQRESSAIKERDENEIEDLVKMQRAANDQVIVLAERYNMTKMAEAEFEASFTEMNKELLEITSKNKIDKDKVCELEKTLKVTLEATSDCQEKIASTETDIAGLIDIIRLRWMNLKDR